MLCAWSLQRVEWAPDSQNTGLPLAFLACRCIFHVQIKCLWRYFPFGFIYNKMSQWGKKYHFCIWHYKDIIFMSQCWKIQLSEVKGICRFFYFYFFPRHWHSSRIISINKILTEKISQFYRTVCPVCGSFRITSYFTKFSEIACRQKLSSVLAAACHHITLSETICCASSPGHGLSLQLHRTKHNHHKYSNVFGSLNLRLFFFFLTPFSKSFWLMLSEY